PVNRRVSRMPLASRRRPPSCCAMRMSTPTAWQLAARRSRSRTTARSDGTRSPPRDSRLTSLRRPFSPSPSRAGGPMPSADEIRQAQREAWAGLSAGWEKWDSVILDQLGPVGAAMIERLDIAEAQQHLHIASGTGEPGLTIAELAPKGRVVLTDLVPEMLEIAQRRATK